MPLSLCFLVGYTRSPLAGVIIASFQASVLAPPGPTLGYMSSAVATKSSSGAHSLRFPSTHLPSLPFSLSLSPLLPLLSSEASLPSSFPLFPFTFAQ